MRYEFHKDVKDMKHSKLAGQGGHLDEWTIGTFAVEKYMLEHPDELIQIADVMEYLEKEWNITFSSRIVSQAFMALELFYDVSIVKGHGHIYHKGES